MATTFACDDCKDTKRQTIWDNLDDDDPRPCFTDCCNCNEDESAPWDDSRCPECGGPFQWPQCFANNCFGTNRPDA